MFRDETNTWKKVHCATLQMQEEEAEFILHNSQKSFSAEILNIENLSTNNYEFDFFQTPCLCQRCA